MKNKLSTTSVVRRSSRIFSKKNILQENAVRMGMRQEQDVAPARKELASLNWQMEDLKKSYVADAEGTRILDFSLTRFFSFQT